MAKLNWTREAEHWLHEIYTYIALNNPKAAAEVIQSIYQKAQLLRDFPLLGHKYELFPDRDIRILFYGHYRIAYLIKDEEVIDILGIFHERMEIERYLI